MNTQEVINTIDVMTRLIGMCEAYHLSEELKKKAEDKLIMLLDLIK